MSLSALHPSVRAFSLVQASAQVIDQDEGRVCGQSGSSGPRGAAPGEEGFRAFQGQLLKANTIQAYNCQRSQPKGAREIEPRAVGFSPPRRRRRAAQRPVVDLAYLEACTKRVQSIAAKCFDVRWPT
jgi:hypothetical protein